LPEVQLGLIPGTGGTQRLPRLIGLPNALDMILRGRNVRPKKALKMGLIDDVVHPAILRDVALQRAHELAAGTRQRSKGRANRGAEGLLIERNRLGRSLVFKRARQSVMKQTNGQYPAPRSTSSGSATASRGDAALHELAMTEVSRQLISLSPRIPR
jgi:3-hydroxyacyl-CoA dehydrogenase/enoyl-CoA hydratase/3-hydroxybutyryl-CoA epimerase